METTLRSEPSYARPRRDDPIQRGASALQPLREEVARVVVGQSELVDRLLVALLTQGHVLLEGVPGLAKTLTLKCLARAIDGQFRRIQFTPDMLPADVIGTEIYLPQSGEFKTKLGPIFANMVLADEINRAPAKVQSALLEAMAERQVTIGDRTHRVPSPFLVLATQNPIEQEGTYALPEAQIDRFMMKVRVSYPSRAEELSILDAMARSNPLLAIEPVISLETITAAQEMVDDVFIDPRIKGYIVDLVGATRDPARFGLPLGGVIETGASPRATISLALAARGWAFLSGRPFVTPVDVKTLAPDVLRHRLILSYKATAEGRTADDVIDQILAHLPVP